AEADETGGKKEEKAVVPFPLFTAVIPLIVGNPARPEQSVEAASTQTAKAQSADAADVSTVVAGNPVQQPADAEAGAIPPQGAAVDLLAKADVPPDAGAVSRMALAKGAAVNGGEPAEKAPVAVNQGSDGKAPAAGDAKAAFSREGLDIVVPGAKGKGAAENGHGAATDTGVTESGAEKAVQLQAPLPAGSRRLGEAAGNAYKDALERAGQGSGRNTPATDNSVQGKAPVNAAAASASTGVDTERVEVVLAAKQGGARAEQGESPARKSQEVKGSDSPVTIGVTLDAAQPRGAGESRSVGQASGERIPTGGEIVSQVREKLEATGRIADDGQITLKLHPQELGELKINMRLDDHNLKVEIVTQNPSVKEALMQNLDTLKETLSRQNISMERFDVSADLRQGFTQGGREERQMAQDNRGVGSGYQYAAEAEEELASTPKYPWESENSLVNLML
ncbi:MAG TPA: flagellar hook-length control protein FliK, partial [Geobacteraceae bacterium]